MLVRNMKLKDYDAHQKLMNQLHTLHVDSRPDIFVPFVGITVEKFKEFLEDNSHIFLALEHEESVIGICEVRLPNDKLSSKRAIIEVISIEEKYMNKGYGTKFVEAVETVLRKKDIDRIELNVWKFNEAAIHFYEKLGFSIQRMGLEKRL